jgi:oligopeptide transport system ATP-binding protein
MTEILTVEDLRVRFTVHGGSFEAVRGLNFALNAGETLAVVGESGSGKSQAFMAMMGLVARNGSASGTVMFGGRDLLSLTPSQLNEVRGREIAMIFQDPMTSLNPAMKIGAQMAEVLTEHQGTDRRAAWKAAVEMLDRVGIPEAVSRANSYPHELSGGMRQRVMIGMALMCQPKVLIADEPTTALDVTVQAQMLELFKTLCRETGTSLVLITHDLGVVAGIADRMMVMYAGEAVETGAVDDLFYDPRHPYLKGLIQSTPSPDERKSYLTPIAGMPPNLTRLPPGCPFAPRCAWKMPICETTAPVLLPFGAGRARACHFDGPLVSVESAS